MPLKEKETQAKTSHTPGPLMVLGRVKDCSIGNFYAIGPKADNPFCPTAYVASREDAILYAAAPDLLAALKDAEEELRLLRMKDTQTVYNPGLRAKISLAIKAAEGR